MTGGTMELLDRAKIVDVETFSANGARHRVPIWVVIVDDAAHVASVKAKKGRWMRERVSDAYGRKYRRSRGSLASMQRPEVLATTLRLEVIR